MIEITLQQAESFVENHPDAEWNGWDIHLYSKDPYAKYDPKGVYRGNEWCKLKVIAVNEKGNYVISNNHARFLGKAGN